MGLRFPRSTRASASSTRPRRAPTPRRPPPPLRRGGHARTPAAADRLRPPAPSDALRAGPRSPRGARSGTRAPVPSAPPFERRRRSPSAPGPSSASTWGRPTRARLRANGKPAVLPSREGHNTVPSIIALQHARQAGGGPPRQGADAHQPPADGLRRQAAGGPRLRVARRPARSSDRFPYEIAPGEQRRGGGAAGRPDLHACSRSPRSSCARCARWPRTSSASPSPARSSPSPPTTTTTSARRCARRAGSPGFTSSASSTSPPPRRSPTASAASSSQRVLVYDLGGGTFDASVLELNDNVYEVISTGGDTFLGGIDFDNAIVEYLLERVPAARRATPSRETAWRCSASRTRPSAPSAPSPSAPRCASTCPS